MRWRVVAIVAIAACSHGTTATPPAPSRPTSARTDIATDPLAYLPQDSEIVISVDAQALARTSVWTTYWPKLKNFGGPRQLRPMEARCNEVLSHAERLTMGGAMTRTPLSAVLVLRIPNARAELDCLVDDNPIGEDIRREGDLVIGHTEKGTMVAGLADDKTVVLQVGETADKTTFAAVLASGAGLRRSAEFLRYFGLVDRSATIWLVSAANARLENAIPAFHVQGVFATIAVTDEIGALAKVRMRDEDEAARLSTAIQSQVARASSIAHIDVKSAGPEITVSARFDEDQIRTLLAAIGL